MMVEDSTTEDVRRRLREMCDMQFSELERLTRGEETNNNGHEIETVQTLPRNPTGL